MAALVIFGFVAAAVIIAVAVIAVIVNGGAGVVARNSFVVITLALSALAFWTTFHCERFVDANTRDIGWPIPCMVFQRKDAHSPWLDFVGPISVLAYPMNLTLFLIVPSLVFLGIALIRFRREDYETDS
jgi:ribose/xylose/arabinose/galactoside ABC-type transport system permease subunit